MTKTELLIAMNAKARQEWALAKHKEDDEREVEKHTYAARVLMDLANDALFIGAEEQQQLKEKYQNDLLDNGSTGNGQDNSSKETV
jgi:hypothetical protein